MEYNRPEPEVNGGLYSIIPRLPWYNYFIFYTIVLLYNFKSFLSFQ